MSAVSPAAILLPYQLRAVRIGVQVTIIVLSGLLLYPLFPGRPPIHLSGYFATIAVAFVGVAFINFLPWRRLFEAGKGHYVMYAWSMADILLISVAIVFTGGQDSEVFLTYLLTTVFFAGSYPLRGQFMLLAFTALSYITVLALIEPEWQEGVLFYRLVSLAGVMFISTFLSQELSRQMQAHGAARAEAERRSALLSEVARSAAGLHGASVERILQITADTARDLGFDYAAVAAGRPGEQSLRILCVSGNAPPAPESDSRRPRDLGALPDSLLRLVLPLQTESGPPMSLLLLSERAGPATSAEHEALDLLLARAGRALDTAGHSDELQRREERFRSLLQHASDLITVLDAEGRVTYQSDASRALFASPHDGLTNDPFETVVHPEDRPRLNDMLSAVTSTDELAPRAVQVRVHTQDGWRHIEIIATNRLHDPAVRGIVLNGRDVSEHVRLAEQLREQALHDPLTGLPNRSLLAERLQSALAARTPESAVALVFIDLDDFKRVNDLFGHSAGDRFLAMVARYFEAAIGAGDTIARFGGDEFVLVLTGVRDVAEVERRADALLTHLDDALTWLAQGMGFTASAGLVLIPHGEDATAEEMLYRADIAMYHAKRSGKARVAVFDAQMASALVNRHGLELELRAAIEHDEFELHYQPMVSLASGAITGVEALVRWRHPARGLLAPSEFVPVAEEIGLITGMGSLVLQKAIAEFAGWRTLHPVLASLRLNVNISPAQLLDPGLPALVEELLQKYDLPPQLLVLEMTEEALSGDVEEAARALRTLKAIGVRLAVDDFGTGYSSLAYLHSFPLDILKIDRSFITRLGEDDGETLVAAIVDLAVRLRLEATAEGIENEAQLAYLRSHGCPLGQGFMLSHPLQAGAALELLVADANANLVHAA